MTTALFTHPACLAHDVGDWHPECPDRLRYVLRALEAEEFAPLLRELAPLATHEQLERVHPADYVAAILAITPTDRAAIADFQAFCRETGHQLLAWSEESGVYQFVIRKKPA